MLVSVRRGGILLLPGGYRSLPPSFLVAVTPCAARRSNSTSYFDEYWVGLVATVRVLRPCPGARFRAEVEARFSQCDGAEPRR